MNTKILYKKTLYIGLFCLTLIFFIGCGKEEEKQEEAPPARKVITGKISSEEIIPPEKKAPETLPPSEETPEKEKVSGGDAGEGDQVTAGQARVEEMDKRAIALESDLEKDQDQVTDPAVYDEKDIAMLEEKINAEKNLSKTTEELPEAPEEKEILPEAIPGETASTAIEPEEPGWKKDADASNLKVVDSENLPEETALYDVDKAQPTQYRSFKKPPPYDPVGKIDPFKPLFSDAPTIETTTANIPKVVKRKKRIPRTPLERIDLSQLKLVGIVRSSDVDRALVEEVNGKGYVVKKGTYIGVNAGKVVQILSDRIVVEEEVENILGKIALEKTELKLQKPFGEE